jgi:Flp pilus assembly protein TadB
VKPVDRDELAKYQKRKAINEALRAELSRHSRVSHVALLLVAVVNVVVLALLAYLLLGHG